MVAQELGRIINISSVEGKQANKPTVSHYITIKHALNGFTKAVAFEYGPRESPATRLPRARSRPTSCATRARRCGQAGISYEQFLAGYAAESLIKPLNTVEEVAAMALLLAACRGRDHRGAHQRGRRQCFLVRAVTR